MRFNRKNSIRSAIGQIQRNEQQHESRLSVGIDAENLFNRFYGVPLATIDDIYSMCTIDNIEINLWMSKKEMKELVLISNESVAQGSGGKRQFEELCSEHSISIDDSRPTNQMMWIQQFYRVFKKTNPEFMYLTHFPGMKFSNSKTVLRVHDPFGSNSKSYKELLESGSWKHLVARALRTHAFSKSLSRHTIVANSEFTAVQFSKIYGIPLRAITVIPYGFKTYEFEEIMKIRRESIRDEDYFLMICGKRGNKRPDVVINEWARNAHRLPKLIVVGHVPIDCLSSNAVSLLNSGNLVLMNFADEESLLQLKINANAMIFASEYEGFGRPVIEALVCGVPSIANDLKVFQEIGTHIIDIFSLENPSSLLPFFEKYTEKVDLQQSKALVTYAEQYAYNQIGKKWEALLTG